ncbi:nodulin MtN21 /EamA-like transporter family protein [Perilla frutescens var. hirtella]|nr:nodulin MtN21 /EamA-like transporter family protein [Perilla frutescens var. frutescens]KAH6794297.1 nodulin MtN21 /EamA-like transporter family protein [Perilla frutescens var. hirtella]
MMKSEKSSCGSVWKNCKPYIAMISLQFGYAGMNIITKISLNGGMSHYVLVVYRHAIATAVIAPFAFFFERKAQPKITFPVFMQIFVLVIDQNFYYAGLKLTSPTFSCAMSNMLPALTFIMAIIFRMEKVNIKKVIYQAKVVGTIITVAGAMLMTLYKGPLVEMVWTQHRHSSGGGATSSKETSDRDWFIGCILLIIATLAWASLFILQKAALKTYSNHQLSLTSLVCFMGTLQAIAVTFVMEHKPSVWSIGWDMNLLAAAYAGIVTSSISYYVQGLVMKTKGPVFATAFSPLMMIIVAIMGSFILAEKIYLGGVIGSAIIVVGLYSVLWGKYKEGQEEKLKMLEEIPEAIKDNNNNNQILNGNINNNNNMMQINIQEKGEVETCPEVAVDLPIFNAAPNKPTQ